MEIGEDSHSPVTVTSPSNFNMKSEYLILDITTELVELSKTYDCHNASSSVPGESYSKEEDDHTTIEFLSAPVNTVVNNYQGSNIGGINNKGLKLSIDATLMHHNEDIKDKIYAGLVKIYEIATETNTDLDQYVLRELRYLQEFLTHGYPEIAMYIKVPLEEVIVCVKSITKGFNNERRGSSPIPIDTANGTKSPPLSPPAKRSKTNNDVDKNGKKTKQSTTTKVKMAMKEANKNTQASDSNCIDRSMDDLQKGKIVQDQYGFFIDVGNEGDEGLFYD